MIHYYSGSTPTFSDYQPPLSAAPALVIDGGVIGHEPQVVMALTGVGVRSVDVVGKCAQYSDNSGRRKLE